MNTKEKIQQTETFKKLVDSTPFLRKTLTSRNVVESIERIIYQIEKLGNDYVKDKNYPDREVQIAKEIILTKL